MLLVGRTLPQAVIFDWDSTLVDNWDTITLAMNAALRNAGKAEWTRDRMIANSRLSARNSFPEIFGEDWEEANEIFHSYYTKHHLRSLKTLAGAAELLEIFSTHGIRQAICSNKKGATVRQEVKHLGWARHFISVVGAQDTEKDKPDPAPVRLILQSGHMQSGPHIWFVGDMPTDMQCAIRAGCAAVGIGPESAGNPEYYPDYMLPDVSTLLTEMRQLLS
jgi:phosphoglycolate phosphatase